MTIKELKALINNISREYDNYDIYVVDNSCEASLATPAGEIKQNDRDKIMIIEGCY